MKFIIDIPDNDFAPGDRPEPDALARVLSYELAGRGLEMENGDTLYLGVVSVDPVSQATDDEVNAAIERHCLGSDNEREIDRPAAVSRGDDGVWVQGWLFVPNAVLEN